MIGAWKSPAGEIPRGFFIYCRIVNNFRLIMVYRK